MLLRNKRTISLVLSFLAMFLLSGTAKAEDPSDQKNIFIQFYQDHISTVDGARCPMTPSCSEYAAQAMKKHGAVMGWVMACDRLIRCGRDEVHISPKVQINKQTYISDPVSANDFWWFDKEKE